ncbi:MAG: hypothetical protein GY915_02990 [bacterium]|nr:hypothetical protein [bacterium]
MTTEENKGKEAPKLASKSKTSAKPEKVENQTLPEEVLDATKKAEKGGTKKVVEPEKSSLSPKKQPLKENSKEKETLDSSRSFRRFLSVFALITVSASWVWWLPLLLPERIKWSPSKDGAHYEQVQLPEKVTSQPQIEEQEIKLSEAEPVSPPEKSAAEEKLDADLTEETRGGFSEHLISSQVDPFDRTMPEADKGLEMAPTLPEVGMTTPVFKSYMALRDKINQGGSFAEDLGLFARMSGLSELSFSDLHQEVASLGIPKVYHLMEALDVLISKSPTLKKQEDASSKTIEERTKKVLSSLFQMRKANSRAPERGDIKGRLMQLRRHVLQKDWDVLDKSIKSLEVDIGKHEALQALSAHIQAIRAGQEIIKIIDSFLFQKMKNL